MPKTRRRNPNPAPADQMFRSETFTQSRFDGVNPTGRADVALARIVELGVNHYASSNPLIAIAFPHLKPLVEMGCTIFAGPKTQVGSASMMALAALRSVKQIMDNAEARRVGGTNA